MSSSLIAGLVNGRNSFRIFFFSSGGLFFRLFGRLPQCFHAVDAGLFERNARSGEFTLDIAEPRFKFTVGLPQQFLRSFPVAEPGQIARRKQQIAEFIVDRRRIAGSEGLFQFLQLLLDLRENLRLIVPVEADLRNFLLELLRPVQGGQIGRHLVQNRLRRGLVFAFPGLDLLPELCDIPGGFRFGVAEDMGVAADHLVDDAAADVLKGEFAALFGHHRLKDHIHQQIAQLVADIRRVAAVDRIEHFGGLLGEAAAQGFTGLLAVPRAAAGSAEPFQDPFQRFRIGSIFRPGRHQKVNPTLKWNRSRLGSSSTLLTTG